jgi:hypothetical protein
MNKFKLASYILAFFSGVVLIFLVDFDQPSNLNPVEKINNLSSQINSNKTVSTIPTNWTSIKPSSSMRDKEYIIKIDRWVDQFSGDENPLLPFQKKEIEQNDKNFIFVQNSGYFNGGMGQTKAFDNAGLIAFIVEDKSDIYYYKAVSSVEILMESKEELISTILSSNL